MKLRLGAAVILAALTPLTAVSAPSPASAGVDITPPAVGSCHDVTYEEAYGNSDPDPAIDCAGTHTMRTVTIVELAEAPDWRDFDAVNSIVGRHCYAPYIEALGGLRERIQRSAYALFWFIPTKAQRDAGARWIRCDVGLWGGNAMMPLRTHIEMEDRPLSDSVARCRRGKEGDFAVTVCSRAHQLRAKPALWNEGDEYPGVERLVRWALRRCEHRLGRRHFGFYEVPSRSEWRADLRYTICFKTMTT